nr:MAG TPA: hypothetical protein [Caudoviricetes sp.]
MYPLCLLLSSTRIVSVVVNTIKSGKPLLQYPPP